jgi:hypothetical protein
MEISHQTARRAENFYDGYMTHFYLNFNNTKYGRRTLNQSIKIKFIRFQVALLFKLN